MLFSAFSKSNESVFVELLTYTDLEMMKARKTGQPPPAGNIATQGGSVLQRKTMLKRYVILTYQSEFDRVHYPLPLVFEVGPLTSFPPLVSILHTICA
jgi:coiled-coil domain-containing protein 61